MPNQVIFDDVMANNEQMERLFQEPHFDVARFMELRNAIEKQKLIDFARQDKASTDYFDRLLANVREIYEADCIVAGGAVRDLLLDIPPKDIDIFVNSAPPELAKDMAEELGWGPVREIEGAFPGAYDAIRDDGAPFGLLCLELHPETAPCPVQLIFKEIDTERGISQGLLETFDLDICKSSYYNGNIIDTEVAQRDREACTITFCGEGDIEKSHIRATRIQQRMKHLGLDFKLAGFKKMEDIRAEKEKAEQVLGANDKEMKWQYFLKNKRNI